MLRVSLCSVVSVPLRNTNWIVPWVLASCSFCESSGVNKQGHYIDLLWFALRIWLNGLSGCQHLDVLQYRLCQVAAIVRHGNGVPCTSTCEPGYRNPATPTISLMRIAVARIPGGIFVARPTPDPSRPRSLWKMGSLAPSERIKDVRRHPRFW